MTTLAYTVQDLITAAYRTCGLIPDGGTPTSDQLSQALLRFNTLVNNWMARGIYTGWGRATVVANCVAGQQTYTMGATGDFNIARPSKVLQVLRRDSNNIDIPLNEYSKQEFFQLTNKTQVGVPTQFFYNQGFPLGSLSIWPVPASQNLPLTLVVDVLQPFQVEALSDVPALPDYWQEAIVNNLAIVLSVLYARPVNARLDRMAIESLALAQSQECEQASVLFQPDYQRYGQK